MAFYKSVPHTFGQDCGSDLYSVGNFQSYQIDRNLFTLLSVKSAASCGCVDLLTAAPVPMFIDRDENVKIAILVTCKIS